MGALCQRGHFRCQFCRFRSLCLSETEYHNANYSVKHYHKTKATWGLLPIWVIVGSSGKYVGGERVISFFFPSFFVCFLCSLFSYCLQRSLYCSVLWRTRVFCFIQNCGKKVYITVYLYLNLTLNSTKKYLKKKKSPWKPEDMPLNGTFGVYRINSENIAVFWTQTVVLAWQYDVHCIQRTYRTKLWLCLQNKSVFSSLFRKISTYHAVVESIPFRSEPSRSSFKVVLNNIRKLGDTRILLERNIRGPHCKLINRFVFHRAQVTPRKLFLWMVRHFITLLLPRKCLSIWVVPWGLEGVYFHVHWRVTVDSLLNIFGENHMLRADWNECIHDIPHCPGDVLWVLPEGLTTLTAPACLCLGLSFSNLTFSKGAHFLQPPAPWLTSSWSIYETPVFAAATSTLCSAEGAKAAMEEAPVPAAPAAATASGTQRPSAGVKGGSHPFMHRLHFLLERPLRFVTMLRIGMGFLFCVCAQVLET